LLVDDAAFRGSKPGRAFLVALVAQTGLAGRAADLGAVVEALEGPLAGEQPLAREIVLALMSRMSASDRHKLTGRTGALLADLLAGSRATAGDERASNAARTAAVRALRFARFDDVRDLLAGLLGSRQRPELQAAAIETLAQFDDDRVATVLLEVWPGLSPKLRASAAEALFARPAWIGAFLDAVEAGKVGRADLDPARIELLKSYPAATVKERAGRIFAQGLERRQDVVAAYQKALQLPGDPERGRQVFRTHCATCHRLDGFGQVVGAELNAIRDRGLDSVLLNILDPNREVNPQYQTYVVVTTSGRVLTGLIAAESANSLTIRKPDGSEETVLRLDLDEMRSTGLSFMPEGLEKQIDVPAMADLLAYLTIAR
jgi:putative heme-binding domain-containing protein